MFRVNTVGKSWHFMSFLGRDMGKLQYRQTYFSVALRV